MECVAFKKVADSLVETRELIIPNDTNLLGNLLGGRLLHLVDITGAMVASKHSNRIVATANIDSVDFHHPVKIGEVVLLKAKLTWVGNTSMEVLVEVFSENYITGKLTFTNKAYLTFVALGDNEKPCKVPKLLLETDDEKKEYEAAEIRRAERVKRREQR